MKSDLIIRETGKWVDETVEGHVIWWIFLVPYFVGVTCCLVFREYVWSPTIYCCFIIEKGKWSKDVKDIGLVVRVLANDPGDLGSIPGRVIPKTQKMVLDAPLLNTQHYKVRIKDKVEQSKERSSTLLYTLV